MAHQHSIGAKTLGSKMKGGPPNDMYAEGMRKLRELARDKKLQKFNWPKAGGLHLQTDAGEDSHSEEDSDPCADNGSYN